MPPGAWEIGLETTFFSPAHADERGKVRGIDLDTVPQAMQDFRLKCEQAGRKIGGLMSPF